jgi:hypothetical protein
LSLAPKSSDLAGSPEYWGKSGHCQSFSIQFHVNTLYQLFMMGQRNKPKYSLKKKKRKPIFESLHFFVPRLNRLMVDILQTVGRSCNGHGAKPELYEAVAKFLCDESETERSFGFMEGEAKLCGRSSGATGTSVVHGFGGS